MAVAISIRNTFLHYQDAQCTGADEQPGLSRAKTEPAPHSHWQADAHEETPKPDLKNQISSESTCRSVGSTSGQASDSGTKSDQRSWCAVVGREVDNRPESSVLGPVLLGRLGIRHGRSKKAHGYPLESTAEIAHQTSSRGSQHQRPEWTTLMIRNLPNQYTREDFLALLTTVGFAGKFDFLYFPIDFETHAALGYAFVNLSTRQDALHLTLQLDGFSAWSIPCRKVCSVSWSQPLQGLEAHIARYRDSPLMHELVPDAYRPVLFTSGKRTPFPPPTKMIKPPRKGKQRMLVQY